MSMSKASVPAQPAVQIVLMTAPDRACAERLARSLVEESLAACVNLLPQVHSIYRWQEKVETSEEVLLVAKTCTERVDDLIARATALHPYDVPEVIACPVTQGNAAYLKWVLEACRFAEK